jgi:hypothetical protein
MYTCVSSTLAAAPYPTRKELQEVLQSSLTLKPLVFLNELCPATAVPRRLSALEPETAQAHSLRQLSAAVDYFRASLLAAPEEQRQGQGQAPPGLSLPPSAAPPLLLLLVADEQDSALEHHLSSPPARRAAAAAVTMQQFVASVCGPRETGTGAGAGTGVQHPLWELLDSAAAARQSQSSQPPPPALSPPSSSSCCSSSSSFAEQGFSPHLSPGEARRGLQRGTLFTGELNVFPYCSQEAEVVFEKAVLPLALPGEQPARSISSCLVSGTGHRNRAVQGDVVVIEVSE